MSSRRAVILHGTDGNPDVNWLPWAKQELENRGYSVFVPFLPENHTPNKQVYEDFLQASSWDFSDNVIVGHSSGATTALNLLSSDWFPKVRAAILVGTFLNERALDDVSWYEKGQFDNLFPAEGFNAAKLHEKAERYFFIHGDNDPYCLLEDTKQLCGAINGELTIVQDGLHLSSNRQELSELLPIVDHL